MDHATERDRMLLALTGSVKDFTCPTGPDLLERVAPFHAWQQARRDRSLWSYGKVTHTAPRSACDVSYDDGTSFTGVNLATQDYLGLSSHPSILDAAEHALRAHGVHSGGSALLLGRIRFGLALEATLCDYLQMEHAVRPADRSRDGSRRRLTAPGRCVWAAGAVRAPVASRRCQRAARYRLLPRPRCRRRHRPRTRG